MLIKFFKIFWFSFYMKQIIQTQIFQKNYFLLSHFFLPLIVNDCNFVPDSMVRALQSFGKITSHHVFRGKVWELDFTIPALLNLKLCLDSIFTMCHLMTLSNFFVSQEAFFKFNMLENWNFSEKMIFNINWTFSILL